MTSRPPAERPKRIRKPPQERRLEIVRTAAHIALAFGLELVTLRRVADELGVRPGLIGHYFPAADDLVAEAFAYAAAQERAALLPEDEKTLAPVDRIALFVVRLTGGEHIDLSRLWLNARHLSRFKQPLRRAVAEQETVTRTALTGLIEEGGFTTAAGPLRAAVHLLVAIDGMGSYANTDAEDGAALPEDVELGELIIETAELQLGLEPGTLRERARANGVG
ncbi:TetR family transcriptional regulator [Streptomyces indicus]|uniref:Regulatory protein, tetR family n=1 Tax=Streptomyces indicus TaxID=417292 RepID=A0A1G9AZQ7_9ACTN|nr:TetR family transcriptional regulator [Streptomyces indicus]SDK32723.1 regulatory protein, tetR family [Streptomyces indicus]